MSAGVHLKVEEIAFKLRLLKENLPCNGFEGRAVLFLIGEEIDAIPTKARLRRPEALLIIHERTFRNGRRREPRTRRLPRLICPFQTKSRRRSATWYQARRNPGVPARDP